MDGIDLDELCATEQVSINRRAGGHLVTVGDLLHLDDGIFGQVLVVGAPVVGRAGSVGGATRGPVAEVLLEFKNKSLMDPGAKPHNDGLGLVHGSRHARGQYLAVRRGEGPGPPPPRSMAPFSTSSSTSL
jgi:hypothetical protein